MIKFEVGNRYNCSSLYGSVTKYTVASRTAKQVTMEENWISEDTWEEMKDYTTFDIITEGDEEKILVWEYKGHECYIYASESLG